MSGMRLIIVVALLTHASATAATEYLLRLDVVGYEDAPADEQRPHESLLRSIEVTARPNAAFCSRVNLQSEQVLLKGKLLEGENGVFQVAVEYEHSRDSGVTVLAEDGSREPFREGESIQSTTTLAVGQPITLSEPSSVGSSGSGPISKSAHRIRLSLNEIKPSSD